MRQPDQDSLQALVDEDSPKPIEQLARIGTLGRIAGALVMLVVAAASPVMGLAAAEQYESRKFYGVFEGDWLILFGLIAGGSCIWTAVHLLCRLNRR